MNAITVGQFCKIDQHFEGDQHDHQTKSCGGDERPNPK
jgi:hypothetical protein